MKGRPILGIISGFLFGLFGGITLFLYGAVPLASPALWILPLVGIVFGLFMAAWAPFGGGSAKPDAAPTEGMSSDDVGSAEGSESTEASPEGETIEVELKPTDSDADGTGS